MNGFDLFILVIAGVLPLYLFGYLIGVKRYMYLIAGYKTGHVNDEGRLAKNIGVACFIGGSIFLALVIYLAFQGSISNFALVTIALLGGLIPAVLAIRAVLIDHEKNDI